MKSKIELGDTVEDLITGFKGTAIGITEFITGCKRISVQPPIDKDGEVPETQAFDEPMVRLVRKAKKSINEARGVIKKKPASKGGPRPVVSKY